jgi:hypothetical protein
VEEVGCCEHFEEVVLVWVRDVENDMMPRYASCNDYEKERLATLKQSIIGRLSMLGLKATFFEDEKDRSAIALLAGMDAANCGSDTLKSYAASELAFNPIAATSLESCTLAESLEQKRRTSCYEAVGT